MNPNHLPPVLRPAEPPVRTLADLAEFLGAHVVGDPTDVPFSGVTLATADLRPGEVFVALQGVKHHGAAFAQAAADAGARAIVTDAAGLRHALATGLPVLLIENPRAVLGRMSAWVYETHADAELPLLFGVTGSNGKTSTTHLIRALLARLGMTPGLSSTAERHLGDEVIVSRLTTPEAPELHALLALMREQAVEAVAIEVSAQSLTRHRVDGLVFDVAGFSSFSRDHLDDYANMSEYLAAKLQLLTPERAKRAVVSLDSPAGSEAAQRSEIPATTILTPAIAHDPTLQADWVVTINDEHAGGTRFTLAGPPGSIELFIPTIGAHMAANTALGIVMLLEAGISWQRIEAAFAEHPQLDVAIPGRTQLVSGPRGPAVYVDFGHSSDAFVKTLAAVRRVTPGRVLMLFGADGDRDATKRPDMARAAVAGSDIVVITDHHPRFEDPASIRATLVAAAHEASTTGEVYEVSPPEAAIVRAISLVGEGDAILWAGPGHQDYRDIEGVRTPYSARELTRRALSAAGWPAPAASWPNPYRDEESLS